MDQSAPQSICVEVLISLTANYFTFFILFIHNYFKLGYFDAELHQNYEFIITCNKKNTLKWNVTFVTNYNFSHDMDPFMGTYI